MVFTVEFDYITINNLPARRRDDDVAGRRVRRNAAMVLGEGGVRLETPWLVIAFVGVQIDDIGTGKYPADPVPLLMV